jgi:hypothetical protein
MCDYSLHNVKTRHAKVGDKLMTRQFDSGRGASNFRRCLVLAHAIEHDCNRTARAKKEFIRG